MSIIDVTEIPKSNELILACILRIYLLGTFRLIRHSAAPLPLHLARRGGSNEEYL
jgi:hypothetical protein